ncbi:glucose 1-dehydrogenase [Gracilibacillus suaedae]|uniref:glucose 1-dehydrogenase n=1 Tax=Gracilibacillus suaedae TaxID=2820273 RepID=UPI001ABEAB77|nr:glucose 1-dehydrogenase [Gracilibacillus suaedae]
MKVFKMFQMEHKTSIVTGGSRGLGKAMAEALAEAGSNIVIADIDIETAEKTADAIANNYQVKTLAIKVDVTNETDVSRLIEEVTKRFPTIDVLINNAGIALLKNTEKVSMEEWKKVLDVNLNGVFLMSKAVGNIMIKQQSGSIINIASMSGMIINTPQSQAAYNASKAAVAALTKSLASEWVEHYIRVNAIAPGYMKTEITRPYFEEDGDMVRRWMNFTPMNRPGEPDELKGAALYLASEASSYTTGSVLVVDGGYTIW